MLYLFNALALIVGVAAGFALLSFAFAWYEAANGDPSLLEDRFTPERTWLALRLVITETAVLTLTLLLHPLGWFNLREGLGNGDRRTPVILLHGLFQSRACWLLTRLRLHRRGFAHVYTVSLPPWKDVETLTERVDRRIDELRHGLGVEKVHLVGHSMGGLIARNYLQRRGGASRVERCVLLGTPNHGSRLAPFALSGLGLKALPGSDFLTALAEAPLPAGVKVVNLYSRHDNIVLPAGNARLEGVENDEMTGIGHTSQLFHPAVFEKLYLALAEEEP